jgi:hypothetical protein
MTLLAGGVQGKAAAGPRADLQHHADGVVHQAAAVVIDAAERVDPVIAPAAGRRTRLPTPLASMTMVAS